MPKVYIAEKIRDNGIHLLKSKNFKVDINNADKDSNRDELKKVLRNLK